MIEPLLPIETTPLSPTDIQSLGYLFCLDWTDRTSVRNAYQTDVQFSYSAAEQRWGLIGRPRRTVEFTLQAWGPTQQSNLRSWAARVANSRHLVPLFCDISVLNQKYTSPSTFLPCVTTDRRFFAGHRVVVYLPNQVESPVFHVAVIASVTGSGITLTAPLPVNYAKGSCVVPLLVCDPILSLSADILSDGVSRLSISATETAGISQLPPSTPLKEIPEGVESFAGIPILPTQYHYGTNSLSWGTDRLHEEEASGTASSLDLIGSRARFTQDILARSMSRESSAQMIRFFESRAGRLFPFWATSPQSFFTGVEVSSPTEIRVTALRHASDWEFNTHIGITLASGERHIRPISVIRDGSQDVLSFDEVPGLSAESLRQVTLALLCRFDSDEMSEQWYTNTVMDSSLRAMEVLNEKEVLIENFPEYDPVRLPFGWHPGRCSGEFPVKWYQLFGGTLQPCIPQCCAVSCEAGTWERHTGGWVSNYYLAEYFPSLASYILSGQLDNDLLKKLIIHAVIPDPEWGQEVIEPWDSCNYREAHLTDPDICPLSCLYGCYPRVYCWFILNDPSDTPPTDDSPGNYNWEKYDMSFYPPESLPPEFPPPPAPPEDFRCLGEVDPPSPEPGPPRWFQVVNCDDPEDKKWARAWESCVPTEDSPVCAIPGRVIKLGDDTCYFVTGFATLEDPGDQDITDSITDSVADCEDCEEEEPDCCCRDGYEGSDYRQCCMDMNRDNVITHVEMFYAHSSPMSGGPFPWHDPPEPSNDLYWYGHKIVWNGSAVKTGCMQWYLEDALLYSRDDYGVDPIDDDTWQYEGTVSGTLQLTSWQSPGSGDPPYIEWRFSDLSSDLISIFKGCCDSFGDVLQANTIDCYDPEDNWEPCGSPPDSVPLSCECDMLDYTRYRFNIEWEDKEACEDMNVDGCEEEVEP